MSYYDRLQKVIQEQEDGTGKVQRALDLAKDSSQADLQQQQSNVGTLMTGEINTFAEEFGIKQASKLVAKGIGKKVVQPFVKQTRVLRDRDIEFKKGDIEFNKGIAKDIRTKAQERVETTNPFNQNEQAYKIGEGDTTEYVSASQRPTGGLRRDNTGGTEVEGKVVPKGTKVGDNVEPMDATTGLTDAETARLAGIKTTEDATTGEIAKLGAKSIGEQALDVVPVLGEIAMMGAMFGGMIHTGHHAHVQQMADEAKEQTDLTNVQSADLYSGFNRPAFGSMALPSFDTSKNPAMLQE